MTTIFNVPPGVWLLIGAIFTAVFAKKRWAGVLPIIAAALGLVTVMGLNESSHLSLSFLLTRINMIQVDALSQVFGYVLSGIVVVAFVFGCAQLREYITALVYVGAALVVVYTDSMVMMYVFWEIMAVSSAFLIAFSGVKNAHQAALRYTIVHLVGGLILLAGILLHYQATGSLAMQALSPSGVAFYLVMAGVLVNAAAFPFSAWLSDAYPESTAMGGVILSSVTTKTALYVLIRLFLGTHVLITIGVITAVLAVWYGFQENNMRRVLAFGVINQMGFKLVGVGLGTPLALAGVLAHTVCGVIYNAILWMVAGLIIHRTSVTRLSDMPTVVIQSRGLLIAAIVGGLSIAAFPFTGGFVSKSLILLAIEKQHLFGPWILLEMASVGAIFFVTCRWLYGVFFAPRSPGASVITIPLKAHVRPYIAMGILGMLSIGLGVFPSVMYSVFPNYAVFGLYIDQTWSTIYTNLPVVMASLTKILGAVVVFIMVKPSFVPGVLLDTAWLYRRSLRVITGVFIVFLDAVYAMVNRITMAGIQGLCYIYTHSLALGMYLLSIPYLRISGVSINQRALLDRYSVIARVNGLPIIASALGVILMVVFLLVTQS